MKKFLLLISTMAIIFTSSAIAANPTQKILYDEHNTKYITVDSTKWNINWVEYDTIILTNANTQKTHTFILGKNAHQVERFIYFNAEILDDLD